MIAAVSLWLIIDPESGSAVVEAIFGWLTRATGLVFIWSGIGALAFLGIVALGPFGSICLGPSGERPQFSVFSWAAMLFSAGIGTAVLYWSTIEWIGYYQAPPFGVEPRSAAALEWATSYGMFHWGVIGWAFYCVPAVCLAHGYHVRGEPSLNLSSACRPLLGDWADRWPGRLINVLFMVGLLGSASTGIGLTTPLITESVGAFLGVETTFAMTVAAVVLVVGLIAWSVSSGLGRGIRRLSNVNIVLMLVLLGAVSVLGPSGFLMRQGLADTGFMIRQFLDMSGVGYPAQT